MPDANEAGTLSPVIDHTGRDHLHDCSGIAVNVLKTVEVTACDRRIAGNEAASSTLARIIVTSIGAFSRSLAGARLIWLPKWLTVEAIDSGNATRAVRRHEADVTAIASSPFLTLLASAKT
jgi:hypothetical protein